MSLASHKRRSVYNPPALYLLCDTLFTSPLPPLLPSVVFTLPGIEPGESNSVGLTRATLTGFSGIGSGGIPAQEVPQLGAEVMAPISAFRLDLLRAKSCLAVASAPGGFLEGQCLRMAGYVAGREPRRGRPRRRRMPGGC